MATEDEGPDEARAADAAAPPTSLQERLEASRLGRAVVVALMALVVAGIVSWNLPSSAIQRSTVEVVRPFVLLTGLDQNWKVFSPNPRSINIDMYAVVTMEDGEVVRWDIPAGEGPFLAPYRNYRWRKWLEYVRADAQRNDLWKPAAQWIAAQYEADGDEPVRVELVRRWFDTPGPGTGGDRPAWNEFTYYRYDVTTDTGEDLA